MQKTSSSEIGGSEINDLKYQKAIKEIGKLVNINTALKKEVSLVQERYDSLRVDYENLRECYEQLQASDQQRVVNRAQIQQKSSIEQELENTGSMGQLADLKKRIEQLQQILAEREERIMQLEESLQQKHEENMDLFQKNSNLELELSDLMEKNEGNTVAEIEKQKQFLEKELKRSQEWGMQLSKDLERLKKQTFINQISSRNQITAKSSQLLQERPSEGFQNGLLMEKVKKLQRQLVIQKEEAKQVRRLKKQVKVLREEKSSQEKKIVSLTNFITKQQNYIQRFSGEQLKGHRNI